MDFREWSDWTTKQWSPQMWPRAFWFDAFLSHRRLDWSQSFAKSLTREGVRVYHDNDVTVRDGQIVRELDAALQQSRFIVVCVSPGVFESDYCRAEYVPAMEHSARSGIPRVVLATIEESVVPPPEFMTLPRFRVDTGPGVAALVECVRGANRVAFSAERDTGRDLSASEAFAPCSPLLARMRQRREHLRRSDSRFEHFWRQSALLIIGSAAEVMRHDANGDFDEQGLGAARDLILESRRPWSKASLDYVWRCGFVLISSRRGDAKAIGTELFLWVARQGAVPDEPTLLMQVLSAEATPNGYDNICSVVADRVSELGFIADAGVLERALITRPSAFSTRARTLMAEVSSPAARVKIDVPGLDRARLSPAESVLVLLRRVEHLREESMRGHLPLVGSELEEALRRVRPAARKMASGHPVSYEGSDICLRIFELLFEEPPGQQPMFSRLAMPELLSFVYRPLKELAMVYPERAATLIRQLADAADGHRYHRVAAAMRDALEPGAANDSLSMRIAFMQDDLDLE